MSLRDRIKHVIDCVEDQDDSVCMDAAADAILALVRAHLTTDEAVERSLRATAERLWTGLYGAVGNVAEAQRAAITAALGDTHD